MLMTFLRGLFLPKQHLKRTYQQAHYRGSFRSNKIRHLVFVHVALVNIIAWECSPQNHPILQGQQNIAYRVQANNLREPECHLLADANLYFRHHIGLGKVRRSGTSVLPSVSHPPPSCFGHLAQTYPPLFQYGV